MGIPFFLKAGVQYQLAYIFNHLLVVEIKHADFGQKETHIQEYNPGEEAEYSCDDLVSERIHPGKITVIFYNWFQISFIGSLILQFLTIRTSFITRFAEKVL